MYWKTSVTNTPEFRYENPKKIHVVPFAAFEDADAPEFVDSNIYKKLAATRYIRVDGDNIVRVDTCNVGNHSGPVFLALRGDYEYLLNWYHNPHRKANTRHGNYIMLYLTENGYQWKLSESFVSKLLTIPDDITDLFDFG